MSVDRSILKNTVLVMLAGGVAQVVGFLFTIVFGWRFGVTQAADAYYLAMVLPTFMTSLAAGAIKIVFVPVFVEERVKSPDGVDRLVGTMHLLFLLASLLAVVVMAAVQPLLVPDPGTAALVKRLTYVLWPIVPLGMVFGLFNGVYNAYQKFAVAEAAVAVKALVAVGCLLLFAAVWDIYSAVLGQVAGHFAALLLLAAIVRRALGIKLRPRWSPTPGVRRMLRLAVLPLVSYVLMQLNPVVARVILAALPTGSVSIMSYAEKLAGIPSVVLGTGFTTVLLSHWSMLSAEGDRLALATSLNRAIGTLIAVLLPVVTGLLLLRDPLTTLVYGRGAFDSRALGATSDVFAVLALQTVPLYLHMMIVRILLAEKAFRSMFWLNLLSGVLNLGLMAALGIWLGYGARGVAMGMLLNTTLVMIVTAALVHARYAPIDLGGLLASSTQVVFATAVMGSAVLGLKALLSFHTSASTLGSTVVIFTAASMVYIAALRLVGHRHSRWIVDQLRTRIWPVRA